MGHTQDEKARTRERILDVASRRFREAGLDGLSIAELMNEAGLTHGGFYKHFRSREDLVANAVERAAADKVEQPFASLETFIDSYLSSTHRDARANGCAFSALAADIARADDRARDVFTEQLRRALRRMASLARAAKEDDSAGTAMFRLSAMLGALTLARAVNDPDLSDALMAATRNTLKAERRRAAPARTKRAPPALYAAR